MLRKTRNYPGCRPQRAEFTHFSPIMSPSHRAPAISSIPWRRRWSKAVARVRRFISDCPSGAGVIKLEPKLAAALAKLLSRSLAGRQRLPFNHYTASFDDWAEESERFSGATRMSGGMRRFSLLRVIDSFLSLSLSFSILLTRN